MITYKSLYNINSKLHVPEFEAVSQLVTLWYVINDAKNSLIFHTSELNQVYHQIKILTCILLHTTHAYTEIHNGYIHT